MVPPKGPLSSVTDMAAAVAMIPLIERGRELLEARDAALPDKHPARLVGGKGIEVVTREDFLTQTELCLRHVIANGRPLHLLGPDGAITARLSRHTHSRTEP